MSFEKTGGMGFGMLLDVQLQPYVILGYLDLIILSISFYVSLLSRSQFEDLLFAQESLRIVESKKTNF